MSTALPRILAARSAYRFHSSDVLSSSKNWSEYVQSWRKSPSHDSELWRLLLNIAAEASYLGFARTSRLCRALHAAMLNFQPTTSSLRADQGEAVSSAWEGLTVLVGNSQDESVNVAGHIQHLRLAFTLEEGDLNRPIPGLSMARAGALEPVSEASEHRDMDVYLSARLDSLDRCMEEETWIVTQLAALAEDLASGLQSQHAAKRLMRVLGSHKFFHQVDRVCLAGRVPNANQLMVVDACISDRCQVNNLKAGYSCFVNPEGSLFKLRPGTMRIFDDSDRVLGTFASAGRPAQRSIAMIDDMGLRSGLCLAIGRDNELQGFLFLNSCQPQLFRDITIGFAPLISLLGLVATIALDSNGFHKSCARFGQLDDLLPRTSMLFDASEFATFANTAISRRIGPTNPFKLTVDAPEHLEDFLYLPAQVAGTLGELVLRLQLVNPGSAAVAVKVHAQDATVLFSIAHGRSRANIKEWEWMRCQVDYLSYFISNTPLQLSVSENDVSVSVPVEPILQSHRDIRYSVVF